MIQILELFAAVGVLAAAVMLWMGFRPFRAEMSVDLGNEKHQRLEEAFAGAWLSGEGQYPVASYRRSGDLIGPPSVFDDAQSALKAAELTFKRASIGKVLVKENSLHAFGITRVEEARIPDGRRLGSLRILRQAAPKTK